MSPIHTAVPALKHGMEHAGTSEAAWDASVTRATALHGHASAVRHPATCRAQHWRWRRPKGVERSLATLYGPRAATSTTVSIMEISRFHFTACSRSHQKCLQAAIVGFWKRSHTSPRENIATDNHTLYEHTQREYRNALHPRALRFHGFGCIVFSTLFTVHAS